ncbi:MAG: hypothetical protein ACRD2L_21330, partial [Terriglobia bacterium]
ISPTRTASVACSAASFSDSNPYFEFRVSAFNLANRHRLGGIDQNLDSSTFGQINNPQVNSPREIQFGLKFYF